MRRQARTHDPRGVRVLVEMRRDGDGRVTGVVAPWSGTPRTTFSGWLELVRLLEVHIESDDGDEGTER